MASSTMVDDELLQRKLRAFGEELMPITESTRPILLAKLRKLEAGVRGDSKPSPKRRTLLSFSSDESETDVNPSAILSSPSAVNSGQRRSSRRSSKGGGGGGLPRSDSDGGGFVQARHPMRRSMTALEMLGGGGGGGGGADRGVFKSPALPAPSKRQSHSPASSGLAHNNGGTRGSIQTRHRRSLISGRGHSHSAPGSLDLDTSGSDSDISDSSISNIPENRGVDEFPRSRRGTVVTPTHSSGSRLSSSGGTGSITTSARSSLAASRGLTANSHHQHHLLESPSEDGKGAAAATSVKQLNGSHKEMLLSGEAAVGAGALGGMVVPGSDFEAGVNDAPNNSQCVSMILLGILALFFVIVGLIYLGARHKDLVPYYALESTRSDVQPDCKGSPTDVCFEVAVQLKSLLRQIAGEVECGERSDRKQDRQMSLADAETHLRTFGLEQRGTAVSLEDVCHIFTKNSHWGIRLVGAENVAFVVNPKNAWLESVIPEMSLSCRLRKALQNTIYKVSLGLGVGVVIATVLALLYWFWDRNRKERLETMALVEKILEVLQNHHCAFSTQASNLQPFLAIPHVRDMLIPPSDRNVKRRAWEDAVRFIQNHESRVRVETQNVEGEDFVVWRWMQPDTRNNSKYGGGKTSRIWQGQAFETLDTGMNALPCSPTQCLKVRNMFDPDIECEDDWPTHIRDAILEKCHDADIVHLRVDSQSKEGCVYIKCRGSDTAGRVYKDLHGWWFDGKLVTVKYLRLERYHERFPEASTCTKSLKPSGSVFGIPGLSGMRLRSSPSASQACGDDAAGT